MELLGSSMGLLARSGRGIARLIQGLSEGDPVSIGITGVVVVIMIASFIYKSRNSEE